MKQQTAANPALANPAPAAPAIQPGGGPQANNVGKPSYPPSFPEATDRLLSDLEFAPALDFSCKNDSSRKEIGNVDLDHPDNYFDLAQEPPWFETLQEELRYLKARAYKLEHELLLVSNKGKLISQELDLFRQR